MERRPHRFYRGASARPWIEIPFALSDTATRKNRTSLAAGGSADNTAGFWLTACASIVVMKLGLIDPMSGTGLVAVVGIRECCRTFSIAAAPGGEVVSVKYVEVL